MRVHFGCCSDCFLLQCIEWACFLVSATSSWALLLFNTIFICNGWFVWESLRLCWFIWVCLYLLVYRSMFVLFVNERNRRRKKGQGLYCPCLWLKMKRREHSNFSKIGVRQWWAASNKWDILLQCYLPCLIDWFFFFFFFLPNEKLFIVNLHHYNCISENRPIALDMLRKWALHFHDSTVETIICLVGELVVVE